MQKLGNTSLIAQRISVLILALGLPALPGFSQNKLAKPTYAELVAKVKGGDKSINFRDLRIAYADTSGGPDTDKQKKAMMAALNAKNYEEALKNGDIVLDGNLTDVEAHFAEYIASRELQRSEQTEFHKYVLQGLLDSVMHSGDGKSFETAYEVVAVHEEYVVLKFMGLMPSKQSESEKGGHSYDVLEAVNPKTNGKVTLYFNIDIEEKHLKESLK